MTTHVAAMRLLWGALSGAGALAATSAGAGPLLADEAEPVLLAAYGDWSVYGFADGAGARQCYAATPGSQATPPLGASDPDWLLVTPYPDAPDPVVSVIARYELDEDRAHALKIGAERFELLPQGRTAWTANGDVDARVLAAMQGASEATLSASAADGFVVGSMFSLTGFAEALAYLEAGCPLKQ